MKCGKWRKDRDRLIVIIDTNGHTLAGKLRKRLETEGVGLIEFSHKSWGAVPFNLYINGIMPIDAEYRSQDVDVTNFCMLPIITSPMDHRA